MTDLLTRRASLALPTLATSLRDRMTRSLDVVAPATNVGFVNGDMQLTGVEALVSETGVTDPNGLYTPTNVGDETLATRLDIPHRYVRKLRAEGRLDLLDRNLSDLTADAGPSLYRLLRADDTNAGVLRAALSPRYRTIDDFDVLLAMLNALRETGLELGPDDISADLTPRRMVVRVRAPQVQAMAPELLKDYRSPFTGATGADNPTVFAGFRLSNSEVGGGAFRIVPELTVQVCDNGLTMTRDAMKEVHLGGVLPEGVQWSDRTRRKNLELVMSQTTDVVQRFVSPDYLTDAVSYLEESAGVALDKPDETIKAVAKDKSLLFTEAEADGILGMFVRGGQMTAGGVMNAVTAYTQTVEDADRAHDLQGKAVRTMQVAARLAA